MTDNTTRSLRKDAVVNRGRLLAAAAELFAGQVAGGGVLDKLPAEEFGEGRWTNSRLGSPV